MAQTKSQIHGVYSIILSHKKTLFCCPYQLPKKNLKWHLQLWLLWVWNQLLLELRNLQLEDYLPFQDPSKLLLVVSRRLRLTHLMVIHYHFFFLVQLHACNCIHIYYCWLWLFYTLSNFFNMILGTGGGMALPDGKDASGRKQKVCLILFIYLFWWNFM